MNLAIDFPRRSGRGAHTIETFTRPELRECHTKSACGIAGNVARVCLVEHVLWMYAGYLPGYDISNITRFGTQVPQRIYPLPDTPLKIYTISIPRSGKVDENHGR